MHFEDEHTEFKVQFTDEIYKEIIAFANTDGGVVYIGIDDDGNVVGLSDVDREFTRITNGIRDAIMPDVTMFVRFTVQENKVVRITVGEGTNKPYYLKGKGLKPSGVYVRQGASSVPASPELIRQMIKDSDGDVFEEMRALNQELTFDAAKEAFERYGVEFGREKYRALGIAQKDGLYTNLGLLLSDQCMHTVKIAVFGDADKTTFRDHKEFRGSVFTQLNDAFDYLQLCNRTTATFRGLERVESPDYPQDALREALLNAIVHRDYGFSGSIIINVSDEEMEFISIGGLVSGLSTEDIRSGISQPRNPKLAEVFHRLRLIESYGTGIRRIYHLYAACARQPRIEVTANTFKMVLPNMNAGEKARDEDGGIPIKREPVSIGAQENQILNYLRENGQAADEALEALLNVKKTRVYELTRRLKDKGLIVADGRGKNKKYRLSSKE